MPPAEKLKVKVFNQELTIRSEDSEEYVREIARYVDAKIYEVQDAGSSPTIKSLIIAAMNIADELYKERERHSSQNTELLERSKKLLEKFAELGI